MEFLGRSRSGFFVDLVEVGRFGSLSHFLWGFYDDDDDDDDDEDEDDDDDDEDDDVALLWALKQDLLVVKLWLPGSWKHIKTSFGKSYATLSRHVGDIHHAFAESSWFTLKKTACYPSNHPANLPLHIIVWNRLLVWNFLDEIIHAEQNKQRKIINTKQSSPNSSILLVDVFYILFP